MKWLKQRGALERARVMARMLEHEQSQSQVLLRTLKRQLLERDWKAARELEQAMVRRLKRAREREQVLEQELARARALLQSRPLYLLSTPSQWSPFHRRATSESAIARPPGTRLFAVAKFLCTKHVFSKHVQPAVADWQAEYIDAFADVDTGEWYKRARAAWLRVLYSWRLLCLMGPSQVWSLVERSINTFRSSGD